MARHYSEANTSERYENRIAVASLPDLDLILDACPEIAQWSSLRRRSWRELLKLANEIRPLLGISPDAWLDALAELGKCQAAIALAIIYQKYSSNEVREPGGYLGAMTDRHRIGQLRPMYSIRSLQAVAPAYPPQLENSGRWGHRHV